MRPRLLLAAPVYSGLTPPRPMSALRAASAWAKSEQRRGVGGLVLPRTGSRFGGHPAAAWRGPPLLLHRRVILPLHLPRASWTVASVTLAAMMADRGLARCRTPSPRGAKSVTLRPLLTCPRSPVLRTGASGAFAVPSERLRSSGRPRDVGGEAERLCRGKDRSASWPLRSRATIRARAMQTEDTTPPLSRASRPGPGTRAEQELGATFRPRFEAGRLRHCRRRGRCHGRHPFCSPNMERDRPRRVAEAPRRPLLQRLAQGACGRRARPQRQIPDRARILVDCDKDALILRVAVRR